MSSIEKTTRDFIEAIASNMAEVKKPLAAIRDVLEDDEALLHLGITDEDQEMVEEAHDMISRFIKRGLVTLDQAPALVTLNSHSVEMVVARNLMDDDLCEQIHGTVETEQQFLDAYLIAHRAKFGKDFILN